MAADKTPQKPATETLRDIVLQGAERFERAGLGHVQGMPEAIDEAVYLALAALGLPPEIDDSRFDMELDAARQKLVQEYYRQRIEQRRPASYITNSAWFAGLEFYVDERVLIPRSPFAELIAGRYSPWVVPGQVKRILDLCTGSGCIAIASAAAFPEAAVVASDISVDALEVAAINRERHGLEDRLELVCSDLFSDIPRQPFDLIVSNPPYVSAAEMAELDAEFEHEPALGLAAGEQGLDLVIPILLQARDWLTDAGVLIVEVGYTWPVLQEKFPQVPFMWLEFEHGGEGVFTLTARELEHYRPLFEQAVRG